MIDKEVIHRISGLDKLGERCNFMFHDAELKSLIYKIENNHFKIELKVQHWIYIGNECLDVLITFKMNDVQSFKMDSADYTFADEIYFELYDGKSQGYFDDCMLVSSDMGFSIVCKNVNISVEELK